MLYKPPPPPPPTAPSEDNSSGLGASSSGWLLGWAPCGYFRVKSLDDVVYTAHLFLVAFL